MFFGNVFLTYLFSPEVGTFFYFFLTYNFSERGRQCFLLYRAGAEAGARDIVFLRI
jgi:hypothetical protein